MPTLNINGKQIAVDDSFLGMSPEQQNATVDEIAGSLGSPVTAGGLAKAAGVGVAKGAIGLAGAPADLTDLAARGVDWAAGTHVRDAIAPVTDALGSANIQKKIEGYTGEFRKPQNTAEEWANTAGEFAPLIATGPGGLVRRGLTNVVAPTVGSEVAGSLTKGTEAEPYARAAGAILAGAGASKLGRALDAPAAAIAPTVDELKDAARGQYNHPEVKAVVIQPRAGSDLALNIKQDLHDSGFHPSTQGPVYDAVNSLEQSAGMSVADVDRARKRLGIIANEKDVAGAPTANAAAAAKSIEHINDFLPNLKQSDLISGNAKVANFLLSDARSNWGAAKRAELVGTKAGNAELMAASTYGGGNINNATRQQFRPLLMNNGKKIGGYSPEAEAQLNRVVRGGFVGNTARQLGRLAPTGPVGFGMHAIGAFGTGGASIPLALAAHGAKKFGEAITKREVAKLSNILRSDSPLARLNNPQGIAALQRSNSPIAQAILRAIVAAQQQPLPAVPAMQFSP